MPVLSIIERVERLEELAHPPVTDVPDADDLDRALALINDRLHRLEAAIGVNGSPLHPAPQGMARLDGKAHWVCEHGVELAIRHCAKCHPTGSLPHRDTK